MPGLPDWQWLKKPRQPKTASSERLKLLALQPSEMSRPWMPLRQSHSKGNMATSCMIRRCKSSNRRAEVKLTSSPPARLLCTPAHRSSKVLWLPPTTFYWGRHLHHLHSSYCRGLPQCKISPLQLLLPYQFPSSLIDPKDDTPPQIPWRACLWAEPPQRWLWEDLPAPSNKYSHLGTEPSSQAALRHSAETLTW